MNRLPHQARFTAALRWALGTAGGRVYEYYDIPGDETYAIRIPTKGGGIAQIRWSPIGLGRWRLEVQVWTRRPEDWRTAWLDCTAADVRCRATAGPHELISIAAAMVGMGGAL